ncbi:MAG: amidase [Proteobacteria bacterium]|nr:amidase [Pseudomonadota bacterium]
MTVDLDPIVALTACALSDAIHARRVSCREVMTAYLARIDALNPACNAIVSLQPRETLLAQADARDADLAAGIDRGFLHGFPMAIKDIAATVGIPTTLGSPLLANYLPAEDGYMVARMKTAGGIVIGKTNTPEFGLGSHTYNTVFGITRNAYDRTRSAGGSSGGSAVSLALRLQPVADGSDFMGSLRNPAGWNNVFGFRPSPGRVPYGPLGDQYVSQLGTEGPMGRTVRDLAMLFSVQAGREPRAPLSIAEDGAQFAAPLREPKRGLRIGWLGNLGGYLPMEPGILATCEAGLRRLEGLGCSVEPASLGYAPERVWQTWLTWRRWLVSGRVEPFYANPAQRERLKPEARWEAAQGAGLSGADTYAASLERSAFYAHMLTLFERHDFLVLPTAQVWPFAAELDWPKEIAGVAMDTYHRWMEVVIYATLAGLPAISVPAGFDDRGLPMGMQLIGPPLADRAVLELAAGYEATIADLLAREPTV